MKGERSMDTVKGTQQQNTEPPEELRDTQQQNTEEQKGPVAIVGHPGAVGSVAFPDPIVTDVKQLRVLSRETTWQEVGALGLRNRIRAALPTAWCKGYGLAAIQIGVPVRYAWAQVGRNEIELLNPRIVRQEGPAMMEGEGCLSFPNRRGNTIRFREVEFESDGVLYSASGMEAVVIQHEIDHMNGVLYIDRLQNPYPKLGRNERCPCGSGKKYKICCLK